MLLSAAEALKGFVLECRDQVGDSGTIDAANLFVVE